MLDRQHDEDAVERAQQPQQERIAGVAEPLCRARVQREIEIGVGVVVVGTSWTVDRYTGLPDFVD
jgi:hypothetical protein